MMNTFIAILRGINLGGHKSVKMTELVKLFDALHLKNAKTYIQSGNVVFQSKDADKELMQKKIQKKISDTFGFEVPVLVRDPSEFSTVLKNNPFQKRKNIDLSKLHVTFLNGVPDKKIIDKIAEQTFASDEFVVVKQVIYLYCPNGYGNTKLSNTFWESKLKLTATTRNWKTVNELKNMSDILIDDKAE